MTALRDLLASLWAALWLHARLLRIRVRRLFGRGSGPEAGVDYHLTKAETPVEGVDYDPTDLPAELQTRLEAKRADLVAHVAPVPKPRRGRRIGVTAVAVVLSLGVVGAGASALVAGSTGVPAMDRLLGIFEAGQERPEAQGRPGLKGNDARPDSSRRVATVEVTIADGSRIVSSSYVSGSGKICSGATDVGAPYRKLEFGALACLSAADLADRIEQADGYLVETNVWTSGVILRGFVSSHVASLSGRGPVGSLDVTLGKVWEPDLPGLPSLKSFVATGGRGDKASQMAGDLEVLRGAAYTFSAVMDDGNRIEIRR